MPRLPLVTFHTAAAFVVPNDGKLPSRLKVAHWGRKDTNRGPVVVSNRTVAELPGNQARERFDKIALDWNHNTVQKDPKVPLKEPISVAAYGIPEVVPGEGLFLRDLEWTDDGRKFAAGGHYPDISPTIARDPQTGEILFLHSVALCRQGEIPDLPFDLKKFSVDIPSTTTEMNPELLAIFAAAGINLPADATPEAFKAELPKVIDLLKPKKPAEPAAGVTLTTDQFKALNDRITNLETFRAEQSRAGAIAERQALITAAQQSGKVVPFAAADVVDWKLETLSATLKGIPATVPMGGAKTPDNPGAGNVETFSAELLAIAKNCGVSEKELKDLQEAKKTA